MGRYDFVCSDCGKVFEVAGSIGFVPVHVCCPECGSSSTKRKYRIGGIIFKGSGFYSTDNKKK